VVASHERVAAAAAVRQKKSGHGGIFARHKGCSVKMEMSRANCTSTKPDKGDV